MGDPEMEIPILKNSQREYLLTRHLLRDTELSYGRDRNELCNEVECLRAEKAELIEALRELNDFCDRAFSKEAAIGRIVRNQARQTLAKIETK